MNLAVTSDSGPVLRHALSIEAAIRRWRNPVVLGDAGAVGTLVVVGYDVAPPPEAGWPARARWLSLDAGGAMFTAAGGPADVRASLDLASAGITGRLAPLDLSAH